MSDIPHYPAVPSRTSGPGERRFREAPATPVTPARAGIAGASRINPLICFAFYLMIASIPFEGLDLGIPLEPTMVTVAIFLLCAWLQPRQCYRLPGIAGVCFAAFLYGCVMLALVGERGHLEEVLYQIAVITQLVVLFWVSANLFRDERIARRALWVFIGSCLLLAVLQISGVTSDIAYPADRLERITALGENPNTVARILALGSLTLMSLIFGVRATPAWSKWFTLPILALFAVPIVQTGSRGALLALAVGMCVLALASDSLWIRVRNVAVILAGLVFLSVLVYNTESVRVRFEKAVEEGNLAKREQIYPLAIEAFMEKPYFGWGPVTDSYELGTRLRQPGWLRRDAHNLILAVAVKTGVAGLIPFLAGTLACLHAAWVARKGPHGILPLALMAALLLGNMSSSWLLNKLHWLICAYAWGIVHPLRVPRGKP